MHWDELLDAAINQSGGKSGCFDAGGRLDGAERGGAPKLNPRE